MCTLHTFSKVTVEIENVCRVHTKRQVLKLRKFNMFITAVCVCLIFDQITMAQEQKYLTSFYAAYKPLKLLYELLWYKATQDYFIRRCLSPGLTEVAIYGISLVQQYTSMHLHCLLTVMMWRRSNLYGYAPTMLDLPVIGETASEAG